MTRMRSELRGGAFAACAVLLTAALPASAANELNPFRVAPNVWVYADMAMDGFDDYTVTVFATGTYLIPIRVTGGEIESAEGEELCHDKTGPAQGNELCALSVLFEIDQAGKGEIVSFSPAPGVRSHIEQPDRQRMRLNLTRASAPFGTSFPPPELGVLTVRMDFDGSVGVDPCNVVTNPPPPPQIDCAPFRLSAIPGEGEDQTKVPASVPASAFGPYRDDHRLFDGPQVRAVNVLFVPEPATPLLMTAGIGGLALLARVRGRRRGRP